jgi:outer membrane cobalamin receptor
MDHALCVFAIPLALVAATAIAAEPAADPAVNAAESSIDRGAENAAVRPKRVEITGSNIKRAEGEKLSSPVKVITLEEIEKSGSTDIRTVLRRYQ